MNLSRAWFQVADDRFIDSLPPHSLPLTCCGETQIFSLQYFPKAFAYACPFGDSDEFPDDAAQYAPQSTHVVWLNPHSTILSDLEMRASCMVEDHLVVGWGITADLLHHVVLGLAVA